ncbi:TfoX/Sxy family protein [Halovulum sp. GXIMD14793]
MTSLAEQAYVKLIDRYGGFDAIVAGQMFGKSCLKVGGKAFAALQGDFLVFKLTGDMQAKALSEDGACLWGPSGAGRPMKEWVAVPADGLHDFSEYSEAALNYVKG